MTAHGRVAVSGPNEVLSKTRVDQLGYRLRDGGVSESILKELEGFRSSYGAAYHSVSEVMRSELNLRPTGRPAKSTLSIVEKLRRETIRLTQMQDVAGCRIVVPHIKEQDETIRRLRKRFNTAQTIDRRERPSHGYRAVHLIVTVGGRRIEIQVRTELQHLWAEWCEKFADLIDPSIKYGGGPQTVRLVLDTLSDVFREAEHREARSSRKELTETEFLAVRRMLTESFPDVVARLKGRKGGSP